MYWTWPTRLTATTRGLPLGVASTSTSTPLLSMLARQLSRLTAFRSVVWGARIQRFQDGTGSARHASIQSWDGSVRLDSHQLWGASHWVRPDI